jgi:hypothetical protein
MVDLKEGEALYETPEGDVQVVVTHVGPELARIIWNEPDLIKGCVTGRQANVRKEKLRNVERR